MSWWRRFFWVIIETCRDVIKGHFSIFTLWHTLFDFLEQLHFFLKNQGRVFMYIHTLFFIWKNIPSGGLYASLITSIKSKSIFKRTSIIRTIDTTINIEANANKNIIGRIAFHPSSDLMMTKIVKSASAKITPIVIWGSSILILYQWLIPYFTDSRFRKPLFCIQTWKFDAYFSWFDWMRFFMKHIFRSIHSWYQQIALDS